MKGFTNNKSGLPIFMNASWEHPEKHYSGFMKDLFVLFPMTKNHSFDFDV